MIAGGGALLWIQCPLRNALKHFSQEVVDDDRPSYGIHTALEELLSACGDGSTGRSKLGAVAGHDKTFVDEVMLTAQTERHFPGYKASRVLSDQEYRDRARALIDAYANSVSI